ncbi:hypothetical protein [Mycoplasmoides alvi]|uniref:hypothetical protein n=1 Tax=Mycoplasmoides alvi TaxID=78580 RepID=UPI00051B5CCD|nr:hypothetical protein [Mycoplasmoides alvi]
MESIKTREELLTIKYILERNTQAIKVTLKKMSKGLNYQTKKDINTNLITLKKDLYQLIEFLNNI